MKVVEDSASVVHLVLPPDPKTLSDSDLKKVAGGAGTITQPGTCFDSNTAGAIHCNRK